MRTNLAIATDYLEYVSNIHELPKLAKALHKHWPHHANWPAHGHMLALRDYWDSLFDADDECTGTVRPLSFHTVSVEARMLVLILGASPDYWFSEVPYQRFPEKAHQDEEAPSEDDSLVPWTDPPLPPSSFLLPFRPGATFYADLSELRYAACIGRATGRALGWAGGLDGWLGLVGYLTSLLGCSSPCFPRGFLPLSWLLASCLFFPLRPCAAWQVVHQAPCSCCLLAVFG